MAIKFEANFTSAISEIAVVTAPQAGGGATFTHQIDDLLSRAQTAYGQRAYSDAVALHKQVRSLIFTLLNPAHASNRHVVDDLFVLPVTPALENKIAEAGLKLAEVTEVTARPVLPPIGVVGATIPADAARFDAIGYLPASVSPRTAAQAALGVDLLDAGFSEQAAGVLDEVVHASAAATTPEGKALAASAGLDLSAAQLLSGHATEAAAAAVGAQQLFTALGDSAGQAQALHNQGVALTQSGHAQDAQPIFARAATISRTLTTATTTTPAPAPARPPAPAPATPAAPAGGTSRFESVTSAAARALTESRISTEHDLSFITAQDTGKLALRLSNGFSATGVQTVAATPVKAKPSWGWAIPSGATVAQIAFKAGVEPDPSALIEAIYKPRIAAKSLADLRVIFTGSGETNAYLTHLYAFVVPQALGDCYSGLGQYELAETYYLQAAQYTYINQALEAPALWIRLAENTVRWADSLFRNDARDESKPIYAKLITDAGAPGTSPLYALAVFAGPAADAKKLIANLASPQTAAVNPAIAKPILSAWSKWQYLLAGLDFFGTVYTPILTFEYLQQSANDFAQQAVQAEREYIDFQARSEAADATRRQLQSASAMANAAVAAQAQLRDAAASDAAATAASQALAQLRAKDAATERSAFATDGYWQYVSSSIAAAHSAHADWHEDEIRQLAANMEAGSWSGDPGKLAAAATLLGGQKSFEYQLDRLDDTIGEMNATIPIAADQAAAASHRAEAARLQFEASVTQAALASDALSAFDSDVFTPEVWARMAQIMRGLSENYLDWAIRVAQLMERAYNFENDDSAAVIRSQYPGAANANDLFGADFLLRDIGSFTYRFIADQRSKQSQLKDVISLANQYPFNFLNFPKNGQMTFETTLHDADMRHPGFYEQRIVGVEVEVIGLLPPEGVRGSLRAGGVSRYRNADGSDRTRLHTSDTLALSEFSLRNDGFVFRIDPRIHGLFEGHGVATTWTIDFPRRSNNLDYRLITDVRLVLYYSAYYSQALHDKVLAAPPQPGEMFHARSLLLRFDFPEAWYTLLDKGEATFTVGADYLPRNELNFRTQTMALVVAGADGVPAANVAVTLTPPGKAAATMSTDAGGMIVAQTGNPLAAQLGGNVVGDWHIAVKPAAGSPLLADDKLDGDKLDQISLLFQYQFDWPA